jgi:hypothetical protein
MNLGNGALYCSNDDNEMEKGNFGEADHDIFIDCSLVPHSRTGEHLPVATAETVIMIIILRSVPRQKDERA